MKILVIRGRNIASLDGEFCLDFTVEPLFSAGIFAISGPTGAGKSTLLDAMCLALFARTPRTDQAKENNVKLKDVNEDVLVQSDPRFLLRRGTASGYAEVDFVALNGHRYRSRWAVGRARDKESGRLQSARITLFNLDKGEEEQGSRSDLQARIIELIGLTFDQFTRSVLLAQNDFSTFLKAEQGEKASLLEKLTGTEQYSAISRLIFEKNGTAKEAYDRVAARIQGIELLTEEEEQLLHSRLTEVEAAILRLEKAKAERQMLMDAMKSVEQQITLKQTQEKEAAVRLTEATNLLSAARKEYEQGAEQQQQMELRFKSLQAELQQARKVDVQLESVIRSVSESETKLKEADKRKKETEDKLQNVHRRHEQALKETADLKAWYERYRNKEGIARQLTALLLHLDAAFAARQSMDKVQHRMASIRKTAERLPIELRKIEQSIEAARVSYRKLEDDIQNLEQQQKEVDRTGLETEIEFVRSERERLLVEQARGDIQELRKKLEKGMPCPVCGSTHHPVLDVVSPATSDTPPAPSREGKSYLQLQQEVSGSPLERGQGVCHVEYGAYKSLIDSMTLRLQNLIGQTELYTSRQKQLSGLQQQQLQLHKSSTEAERTYADLQGQQKLSVSQLASEEAQGKEQSEILAQSLSAANKLFGSDDWQKGWTQDPETFRDTLTDFARRWHDNADKLQQLELQQSGYKAEYESLSSFLPALDEEAMKASLYFKESNLALTTLQTERAKLLNGKSADQVELEYTRSLGRLQEQLKRLLAVQTEQSGIVEQSRGIVAQIVQDLSVASESLIRQKEALELWLSRFTIDYEGQPLDDLLSHAMQEKTECSFRLRTYKENKKKVENLKDELTACREISERWMKLNDLAGSADGAKFRRIAQGYTLDVLLNYANVQLRGLSRRYRLERVPDTLALQVIDQDMCDEVRTVHSLSGGESFLVSLALALGLSSLSSNRMKVESLFIDEGFGSLDAETLRVAMDALESLHTQGRKIGVISHVQEMTERIPVQVRVNRAGNGRSYLEVM